MTDLHAELERQVPAAGLLGYLNFSQGKPDPRWQRQLEQAFCFVADRGAAEPWRAVHAWLAERLQAVHASGAAAFRDVSQAAAVLERAFVDLPAAYRRHHADLLFHQSDRDLFQPFFLARVCEAVLAQGAPWDADRIVPAALAQLNDFVGHRPIALLETRPRGEPYEHERVRPIPLYLREAGVAGGRYHDLVAGALEALQATDPRLLDEAHFDPALLDEFALDPRAYDHGHPVNRRPNYVFGEWDPHHLDSQGRFRRYVVRQVLLDALLDRVARPPAGRDPAELLREAAAVLAGTVLMATGVSGTGPETHDSGTTLATLVPRIARYRDAFYEQMLGKVAGPHGDRLRQEATRMRQPFGGARQHLNHYLARHRAEQMQQRQLALVFAEMGYPEASRQAAAHIPTASVRLTSEVLGRLTTGQLQADRGDLAGGAGLLPEVEDLLQRGIACGAFADPWNILGFQGLFPLFTAREDSVRDTRIDDLVYMVEQTFSLYARLESEAAAAGRDDLLKGLQPSLRRLAAWWDRFASIEVSGIRRVQGGEAAASAEHVATVLAHWRERGEATADLAFWRQHLGGFRSPKAFALVVDALLRKRDHRAALALLMSWLGQAEQVPLEDGDYTFHALALRWMLTAGDRGLIVKFFDYLEANAEEYWQVPALETEEMADEEEDEEENPFGAAYEGVTYRDSTDASEGEVVDGGGPETTFDLEADADRLQKRLRFLATLARLWGLAVRTAPADAAAGAWPEALGRWLATARDNQQKLLALLDAVKAHPVPEPLGSYDSLVEYDRRRVLKEQVLSGTIATCLDTTLAVGTLQGVLHPEQPADPVAAEDWRPLATQLEQALLHGDAAAARALLPAFRERFHQEPLLFAALADGGAPRHILRVRLAQQVLHALVVNLPRLGLLCETYDLLRQARQMELANPVPGRGVSEFNRLFQAAFQAVVESVVTAAAQWEETTDQDLVHLLERVTEPFLALWIDHSRSLQLSVLESFRGTEEWEELRRFVQRYGADLFHARFMTLANLRGVLHRGTGAYLDYLAENPDPLHPVQLVEDLGRAVPRARATAWLDAVLQAVVENYEEYKDYNTTTTQSDYGENLHALLDFLRLKAAYLRNAWQLRPLVQTHEVLARAGRPGAAVLWEEGMKEVTEEQAAEHLESLAALEQRHGLRLRTVSDLLEERFLKALALDRLCALVGPAMEEAGRPQGSAFPRLVQELQGFTATPVGAGLDVPHWLRRLQGEVQRVRAAQTAVAQLAEESLRVPRRLLSRDELEEQLAHWPAPDAG